MKIKRINSDLIASIVIVFLCIILYSELTASKELLIYGGLGGLFWPKVLILGVLILNFILFLNSIRSYKYKKNAFIYDKDVKDYDKESNIRIIASILLFLLYPIIIDIMGFIISSIAFLCAHMYIFGIRKKLKLFFISFLIISVLVILFIIILEIPFPRGYGLFRSFNSFFY